MPVARGIAVTLMATATLAATALYVFVVAWNEFLFAQHVFAEGLTAGATKE